MGNKHLKEKEKKAQEIGQTDDSLYDIKPHHAAVVFLDDSFTLMWRHGCYMVGQPLYFPLRADRGTSQVAFDANINFIYFCQ